MRLAHKQHRRGGFTLVELMVASALTILIMTVMATGFQMGLQSFSTLKSAGELADRVRTAETMLRLDLEAPHFDSGSGPGVVRLSDFRLDQDPTVRPVGGFFQIRQGAASASEGIDQDGLSSTSAQSHGLSLTVRRSGKTAGDLFAAVDPGVGPILTQPENQTDVAQVGNTFLSEWAEVHWFLDPSRAVNVNGVNTFPLVRRVRLLTKQSVPMPAGTLAEVVSGPTAVAANGVPVGQTNTLGSVTAPQNRLGGGGTPPALGLGSPRFGDDIVITNVTSFEVKPTWEPAAGVPAPRPNRTPTALNAAFPFDDFPPALNATFFDTAMGGFVSVPPAPNPPTVTPARVTGVQILIRIFDGKNRMTRQTAVTGKL